MLFWSACFEVLLKLGSVISDKLPTPQSHSLNPSSIGKTTFQITLLVSSTCCCFLQRKAESLREIYTLKIFTGHSYLPCCWLLSRSLSFILWLAGAHWEVQSFWLRISKWAGCCKVYSESRINRENRWDENTGEKMNRLFFCLLWKGSEFCLSTSLSHSSAQT